MKGTSKVIMGATLVMAASLAIVLALVVVLLAELYCSLLLRRCCRLQPPKSISARPATSTAITEVSSPNPLGVLDAPRSLLFPSLSPKVKDLQAFISGQEQSPNAAPHQLGLVATPPSPNLSPMRNAKDEHLVYISNPIYDDYMNKLLRTPFETPDTSPSRLGTAGDTSSGDDREIKVIPSQQHSFPTPGESMKRSLLHTTPPLSPMKKLPFQVQPLSVSLRDATGSLYTSGSYSNSNNGILSSTSGTPCTSPSW